ncbi:hypothetical protein FQR65_LT19972 [Abscondita terminalis]|nr:hypothetical protein FQR65_LT19972 [Abscondita terminalis]
MNVIYEYRYQQKMYTVEQPDIARQYYLWVTDQSDTLKQSSQQKFEHSINKHEFEVWVNPAQPQDAFLFYSQRWFDLRGSWLAKIFFIAQYFLFLPWLLPVRYAFAMMVSKQDKSQALVALLSGVIELLDYYQNFSDQPEYWNAILEKEVLFQEQIMNDISTHITFDVAIYAHRYQNIEFPDLDGI